MLLQVLSACLPEGGPSAKEYMREMVYRGVRVRLVCAPGVQGLAGQAGGVGRVGRRGLLLARAARRGCGRVEVGRVRHVRLGCTGIMGNCSCALEGSHRVV